MRIYQKAQRDFVVLAAKTVMFPHKVKAKWTGPYKVAKIQCEWVYVVEHLFSGKRRSLTFLVFDTTQTPNLKLVRK